MVVSGLVLGLITLQAGNADDYIAAAMTIDYAAAHIGLENRKFSNNKDLAYVPMLKEYTLGVSPSLVSRWREVYSYWGI